MNRPWLLSYFRDSRVHFIGRGNHQYALRCREAPFDTESGRYDRRIVENRKEVSLVASGQECRRRGEEGEFDILVVGNMTSKTRQTRKRDQPRCENETENELSAKWGESNLIEVKL